MREWLAVAAAAMVSLATTNCASGEDDGASVADAGPWRRDAAGSPLVDAASGVDAARGTDAASDAGDAGLDAADGGGDAAQLTIACGTSACSPSTQVCCDRSVYEGGGTTCMAPSDGCIGAALACSGVASCARGMVCCLTSNGGASGVIAVQATSACAVSCTGTAATQLCATSQECPKGQTCGVAPLGTYSTCR